MLRNRPLRLTLFIAAILAGVFGLSTFSVQAHVVPAPATDAPSALQAVSPMVASISHGPIQFSTGPLIPFSSAQGSPPSTVAEPLSPQAGGSIKYDNTVFDIRTTRMYR